MSKSNAFETSLLNLIFNATAMTGVAENHSSSPITSLYVSLHTSDPGETGTQATNEIAYTSYARVAVVRTSSGWTISGNSVSPAAAIDFPAGTGGSGTATHMGIGTLTSGAGVLLYSGAISPTIVTGNGITPSLTTATAITED
tara:strand:- start:58 stop:486 length:429 start_codon:yes stop_codon:yes gene_type:complete